MHGDDVRMVQSRRGLGLDFESLQLAGIEHGRKGQDLQRHAPMQRDLLRFVDDSHAAAADLADQTKIADDARRTFGVVTVAEHGMRRPGQFGQRWKKLTDDLGNLWELGGIFLDVDGLAPADAVGKLVRNPI